MSEHQRHGPGIRFRYTEHTGFGAREISGYTIDNLDTKTLEQAENNYEKVFVLVRKVLEKNESFCMDVEEERLQCCQEISDALNQNRVISKKGQ